MTYIGYQGKLYLLNIYQTKIYGGFTVAILGNKRSSESKEVRHEKVISEIKKAIGSKKENEEVKQAKEMQEFMERYHFEDLDDMDMGVLRKIAGELLQKDIFDGSMALARGRSEELAKVSLMNAQIEQNWIIIRQLSRLNKNIEKLLEK